MGKEAAKDQKGPPVDPGAEALGLVSHCLDLTQVDTAQQAANLVPDYKGTTPVMCFDPRTHYQSSEGCEESDDNAASKDRTNSSIELLTIGRINAHRFNRCFTKDAFSSGML